MIEVRRGELAEWEAEAILREVGDQLEAVTPTSRRVGERAGASILERLDAIGQTPVGGVLVTPSGGLAAGFLIHAVVRSAEEPVSESIVRRTLVNGLRQATEWSFESLALPPLGMGAGNLDAEGSAAVLIPALREYLDGVALPDHVTIVTGSEYEQEAFLAALERSSP